MLKGEEAVEELKNIIKEVGELVSEISSLEETVDKLDAKAQELVSRLRKILNGPLTSEEQTIFSELLGITKDLETLKFAIWNIKNKRYPRILDPKPYAVAGDSRFRCYCDEDKCVFF